MNMTKQNIRNRTIPSIYLLLFFAATSNFILPTLSAAQPATGGNTKELHIAIMRDISPSMQKDDRHKTAGEVLKMAASLLDCQITVIEFASQAKSASFVVPADRDALYRFLGQVSLGKSTSYISALENIPPTSTAAIFLSDGEPSESKDNVLDYLEKNVACPLHTVSIGAKAEELLRKMAASTGGSFYRARDARTLVDAFLAILSQVASFRTLESCGKPIELPSFSGRLLCIGIDAAPTIKINGISIPFHSEHRRKDVVHLPEEDVFVVSEFLDSPKDVSVTLAALDQKERYQLIVATFCDSKLNLKLERTESGKPVAKAQLRGAKLPADTPPVKSLFTVLGKDGNVKKIVTGKRDGDTFIAEIDSLEDDCNIQVEIIDAGNGKRVATRAIAGDIPTDTSHATKTMLPADKINDSQKGKHPAAHNVTDDIPATTPHDVKSVRPVKPAVKAQPTVSSEGSVDLRIVAHRASGDVVLSQSGQNFEQPGLANIDTVSLELVRGSMDPRIFAALGNSLDARWLTADGGIERTALHLHGDRYTTAAVLVEKEGRLTCELGLSLVGSPSVLKTEVTFLPVVLRLRDMTAHSLPCNVPQGTILRSKMAVDAQVGNRPVTMHELSEILAAEELQLTQTIEDSTGKVCHSTKHKIEAPGHINTEFVLHQIGTFSLTARLTGQNGKRVWDNLHWPQVRVTPSPLEVFLCQRIEDGNYVRISSNGCPTWVPKMFCQYRNDLCYAVSLIPNQPTSLFIETVTTKDLQADFDSQSNFHIFPADGLSGDVCTVTLRSLSSSISSSPRDPLVVQLALLPKVPYTICWNRLAAAVFLLFFLPVALVLGRSFRRARRLRALSTEATIYDGTTYDSRLIVPQNRFWPTSELLVLRDGKKYQLAYPKQPKNGARLIAKLRQLGDGNVLFEAIDCLPNFPARSKTVLEAGDSNVELDDIAILSVNVGEERTY